MSETLSPCTCPTCGQAVAAAGVLIDEKRCAVSRGDATVFLRPSELRVFMELNRVRPVVASRRALERVVPASEVTAENLRGAQQKESKLLHVAICRLRKQIALIGLSIETAVGGGYRLHTEVVERPEGRPGNRGRWSVERGDRAEVRLLAAKGIEPSDIAARTGLRLTAVEEILSAGPRANPAKAAA